MKRNKRRMFRPNRVVTAGFDVTPGRMQRLRMPTALLVIGLLVSACGGGGGGGNTNTPPQCIQTAELGCISSTRYNQELNRIAKRHRTPREFSNQWGLATIKADRAWAHLELAKGANVEPGAGVTVGVVDTGIDEDHPLFAGKTITEEFFQDAIDENGMKASHGTAVASVIAAVPDPLILNDFSGVAPGADLHMFAIPLDDPPPPGQDYNPTPLSDSTSGISLTTINKILDADVDILNLSFGTPGIIENYDENFFRTNLPLTIAALAQAQANEKKILVWAAGNAHGDPCATEIANCEGGTINASSVEILAGMVARIAELQGHSIAVVAVDEDDPNDPDKNGEIATFSNRCGIAADWCIAAPGVDVEVAYFGPDRQDPNQVIQGIGTSDGTSFAAPMVSGGLALMKQLFRNQLSNTALVTRLFATANKKGKYGTGATYGQGLMDLGAATSPQGATMVASGNTVGAPGSACS